ncbi:MAG: hypothetical protein AAF600_15395 [Bacteroidota bacterium]
MARKGRKLILIPEDEKTLIATSRAHCTGYRNVTTGQTNHQYVDTYNKERAKPFEWTYDATKIVR